MCGFAGVIAWDERYRVSRETLAKMSAAIAHRGPDGEGTYFSPEGPITPGTPQIALAHRRLAIIDPDPRANQPFTDHQGRWVVFNGEIYNYRELKHELKQLKPDYEWRTDCDTEVLLVAYDVWGEKCVEHFNGMFAFAIWDGVKQELYLARDRMGQKPLYVAFASDSFGSTSHAQNTVMLGERGLSQSLPGIAFGSELGTLRSVGWINRATETLAITSYLELGYIPSPLTVHFGIGQLQPGTRTVVGFSETNEYEYFPSEKMPGFAISEVANSDPVMRTRELVTSAVQRQLVSDVPLGCFLSGGIDSSVIAASMKRIAGQQQVHTFSIGFDNPLYDEREFAAAVAKHLGTHHKQFTVRPDAVNDLPRLAASFGEPFGDSSALPTHYLARETRAHVKVALSGDGGDELFGGYERYRAMRLARRIRRISTPAPWILLRLLTQRLPASHPKSNRDRFRRFIKSVGLPPSARYAEFMTLMSSSLVLELLLPETRSRLWSPKTLNRIANFFSSARWQRSDVCAALAVDRQTYLPDDLLTKVDRASMLHALEVRSPFMDHELVQFAAGLTTDQLLKGGPKRMLREAFADDLPSWVFKRKKMGFAVPIGEWFRGELRPMLHDHLFASNSFGSTHFNMAVVRRLVDEHESMRQDHSQRLYALLMLELWWKIQRTP